MFAVLCDVAWFISCQVLTTGCLMVLTTTTIVTGLIFLHCCPIMNHEYLQTYGMFASGSMMFLVSKYNLLAYCYCSLQKCYFYHNCYTLPELVLCRSSHSPESPSYTHNIADNVVHHVS